MPSNAFHQLYYHITWSTKQRLPLIEGRGREWLLGCIAAECGKHGGTLLACNAMPDHVHLLVCLPPTACVSVFIGRIKGATSRLFKLQQGPEGANLVWQEGYGVITVRKSEAPKVVTYIQNQQQIHANRKAHELLEIRHADENASE